MTAAKTREGEGELGTEDNDLVAKLRKRLDRERRSRQEAERIAETVAGELHALSQMKTEFISIVSHELRTPLTAIVGFTQSLRRPELRQDTKALEDSLEAISRNADKLQALVDEILTTSLFQHFDTNLELRSIDFRKLAGQIVRDTNKGRLEVGFAISPEIGSVLSDSELLGQILKNLLLNAVKFSPQGGRCTIGATLDGTLLRFWVEDEGIGLTSDQIGHVFEPFWQADSSLTRKFGGVGLGLHVARRLSQILGGDISVESEPGNGSRFTVSIRTGQSSSQSEANVS